jgi:CubicO group peptidase (beta-lactamase class C family)
MAHLSRLFFIAVLASICGAGSPQAHAFGGGRSGGGGGGSVGPQFEAIGRASVPLQGLDPVMETFLKREGVSAAAIAVVSEGRLVYTKGYRYSSAGSAKVTPDSVFLWASLTKPITQTLTYREMELRGQSFAPATRVMDVLGSNYSVVNDPRVNQITIADVLGHRGGWDRDRSGDTIFERFSSRDARVRSVLSRNLDFAPGTQTVYSNFGYQLLARLHEKISGKTYFDWLQARLLGPLAMYRTSKAVQNKRDPDQVPLLQSPWSQELDQMDGNGDLRGPIVNYARYMASFELKDRHPLFITKGGYWEQSAIPFEHTGRLDGQGSWMIRMNGSNRQGSVIVFWNSRLPDGAYTQLRNEVLAQLGSLNWLSQVPGTPKDLFSCYRIPSFYGERCSN